MALIDWYELVDRQSIAGQVVNNVYHVQRASGAFAALDIITAYIDTVIPAVLPVQPAGLVHDIITCQNLDEPTDFATSTISPNVGTLAGTELSTFSSAAIQFNRRRTDMKNGQKRWVAGVESSIAGNLWGGAFLALLDTLGAAVVSDWEQNTAPGITVCNFGIIKRVCNTSPSPPCTSYYRLPEDDLELVFYTPVDYLVRTRVRSQVSRKRLV